MNEPHPADGGDRIALLATFVRIVEAGSLSAAAVQLGTSQPTVSRRLKALEAALGLRLVKRSTREMTLTGEGERCLIRARELVADWMRFEADLRGARDEPEGRLRVVVPHAFGQEHLIAPLVRYLTRYERVSVDWLLHDSRPDFLASGVDCAIEVGEVGDPSVVALRLGEVERIAVAAPGMLKGAPPPEHPAVLEDWPWLAYSPFYRDEVALFHEGSGERYGFPVRPRLGSDNLYALSNAARAGLGAVLVSAWMVREDLRAGRLVRLAPAWRGEPVAVHIVYPYARFYPARLRRFAGLMREMVPALLTGQQRPDLSKPDGLL